MDDACQAAVTLGGCKNGAICHCFVTTSSLSQWLPHVALTRGACCHCSVRLWTSAGIRGVRGLRLYNIIYSVNQTRPSILDKVRIYRQTWTVSAVAPLISHPLQHVCLNVLSRERTAEQGMDAAHSTSRWINQSVFQLGPSISRNNLGDIIKVPFCHSGGQRTLLLSSVSLSLIVGTEVD